MKLEQIDTSTTAGKVWLVQINGVLFDGVGVTYDHAKRFADERGGTVVEYIRADLAGEREP